MVRLPDGREVQAHREDGGALPAELFPIGDNDSAKSVLADLRSGRDLLWTGDWHHGRKLLAAVRRRIKPPRNRAESLADRWRETREHTRRIAERTGRIWILVDAHGQAVARRAPPTAEALAWAFGPAEEAHVLPLPTVIGALGAAGWTRKGLEVPGLKGRLEPRYGVFSPTRHAYVGLLDALEVRGRRVLDTGCGTGVLGFVALQRGAREVLAVDIEPRAVACALNNARRLGLEDRFRASEQDLFWAGERVDLALFNPPWLPEPPRTRLDRAVFDDGAVVRRWLHGLDGALLPGGMGALLVSDLAVRLGLRPESQLPAWIAEAGLACTALHEAPATHRRARDPADPLHAARAQERVQLWVLRRAQPSQSGSGS